MSIEIDELGAHVSAAGGVENAPARAEAIGAAVLQLFTKQPNRWAEPRLDASTLARFQTERARHGIRTAVSHDSYLINLASPDPALRARSLDSFRRELERCEGLGVDYLVTHPGNATDGDRDGGVARNAEGVAQTLEEVGGAGGTTRVLFELTAGAGTSVGGTFEDLASLIEGIPRAVRHRVGVCFDTCHAWASGYDLVGDYDGVWAAFADALERDAPDLFHLNDSMFGLGSHRDRHAGIGEGTLGLEPFRRVMNDRRFTEVPKVLETPKGDDPVAQDRANLAVLRALREDVR